MSFGRGVGLIPFILKHHLKLKAMKKLFRINKYYKSVSEHLVVAETEAEAHELSDNNPGFWDQNKEEALDTTTEVEEVQANEVFMMGGKYVLHEEGEPEHLNNLVERGEFKMPPIEEVLKYFKDQIKNECMSWLDVHHLQSLKDRIPEHEIELLQWAGVPES